MVEVIVRTLALDDGRRCERASECVEEYSGCTGLVGDGDGDSLVMVVEVMMGRNAAARNIHSLTALPAANGNYLGRASEITAIMIAMVLV